MGVEIFSGRRYLKYYYFFQVNDRVVEVAVVDVRSHSRKGLVSTLTEVPLSWVTAT